MTDSQPTNELRLKRGPAILAYISRFSATEKVIFGVLFLIAAVTALTMASRVNNHFMTEIPADGGHLREGVIGLPRTINPVLAVTDVDRDLSALVYAGLMKYEDGALVPDLAESYTISDDGKTYSFVLRSDAKFQDGTQLTAADVAFTIQKIQDPALKSPRRPDWTDITVEEVSPTEINFILKQPYAPFLSNMTIGILPEHIWGTVSDDQFIFSQYNIDPIGSGPYEVSGISRDSGGIPTEYSLATWRSYHGTIPHIRRISFLFFPDQERALEALDSGAIDSLPAISPAPASRLAADAAAGYTIVSTPLPRIFGVFFNQNQNSLLSDKVVRQALDLAVDRSAIVESVLSGYGQPLHGPLPPGMSSSTAAASADDDAADAASADHGDIIAAQELLEKNGWKRDPETGIYMKKSQPLAFALYTADTADLKQAAELVSAGWTTLGAQVEVKVFESSDLYQNVIRTRKYDALLFGEQIGKDRDLYAFWHSSQRNAPGLNVAMYTNSKADQLLEDIRTTTDAATRDAKYAQFDQQIRNDVPAIFLYSPDFIYAVPRALEHIDLGSVTIPSDRWNSVSSWYMVTEKVWKIFARNQSIK